MHTQFDVRIVIPMIIVMGSATFASATTSWTEVESQIAWHRAQVRMCGPLSAIRVLHLLGNDVAPDQLLPACVDGDDRGTTVRRVLELCRHYHSDARLVSLPKGKWQHLATPCILLVNHRRHAIVLESIATSQQIARIWDPSIMRSSVVPLDWLEERWTGDAILFQPLPWTSFLVAMVNLALLMGLVRRHFVNRLQNAVR